MMVMVIKLAVASALVGLNVLAMVEVLLVVHVFVVLYIAFSIEFNNFNMRTIGVHIVKLSFK